MKEFIIGTACESSCTVTKEKTAAAVGSGSLDVFATPEMLALMENAAAKCADIFLEDGETSVGTYLGVSHTAATPVGMTVTAKAELTAVNGRELKFHVTACDEAGVIGEGEHTRFVILTEKFMSKAANRGKA